MFISVLTRIAPTLRSSFEDRRIAGVAALAAAALLLESTLTRLLAVAQFYHFAFLVVSLALLGFGASGTLLSLFPALGRIPTRTLLAWSGLGFAASTGAAYAVVNLLPFDSYSIAWDRRQILYFVCYYLALTLPFLCAGLGIGAALAASPGRSHLVYAANLIGSAGGVLLAPAFMWLAGVPGAVLASVLLALLPAAGTGVTEGRRKKEKGRFGSRLFLLPFSIFLLAGVAALIVLGALNLSGRGWLGLALSPYKGLSHAQRYPGSTQLFGRWDAVSRVDVLENAGTRLLPGLSYTYAGGPPRQLGLSVDGDSMLPLPLERPEEFEAAPYMPEAVAFALRPGARTLVLEPGGGLGILQASAPGQASREITAVTGNSLLRQAAALANQQANPYEHAEVGTVVAVPRVYLRQAGPAYGIIFQPLTDAYRPVASGAYSLAETYMLTVEAFAAALKRLEPDGILVVSRWLQIPPSEDVRLVATLTAALERFGNESKDRSAPANALAPGPQALAPGPQALAPGPQALAPGPQALVAYRGIQTLTALVKPAGWTAEELATVRAFVQARRYDLVWAPDILPEETNRYNRLPTPDHYEAVKTLLESDDPGRFIRDYPYLIEPATDDRPFFFHFFRWSQTAAVLATLGRTWQPFGGSGYLILFALLALVLLLSLVLILLPLLLRRTLLRRGASDGDRAATIARPSGGGGRPRRSAPRGGIAGYFGLLGIAFMFVEIPLIQRWLLAFGHATYAFTAVVLVVLAGSSLGSLALPRTEGLVGSRVSSSLEKGKCKKEKGRASLPSSFFSLPFEVLAPMGVAALALITALAGSALIDLTLGWPALLRLAALVLSLAPLAFMMGIPFPLGLAWIERSATASFDYAPDGRSAQDDARPTAATPWAWAVNGCASVIASVAAAILALSYGFTAVLLIGALAYALAGFVMWKTEG